MREASERMPLRLGPAHDGHLAGLRPRLEGALLELGHLERSRGLSRDERVRTEALRELPGSVRGPE